MKEEDFSKILEMEEAYIKKTCDDIIRYAPDLVSFRCLGDLKFLMWIIVSVPKIPFLVRSSY